MVNEQLLGGEQNTKNDFTEEELKNLLLLFIRSIASEQTAVVDLEQASAWGKA